MTKMHCLLSNGMGTHRHDGKNYPRLDLLGRHVDPEITEYIFYFYHCYIGLGIVVLEYKRARSKATRSDTQSPRTIARSR